MTTTKMVSPERIRRYPCFGAVSEESLEKLAMATEERRFVAGEFLCREGDRADYLYIIAEGEVEIQVELGSGEMATVDILVAGEMAVWSAVVKPYRARFACVAKTDVTVLALESVTLRELTQKDHEFGFGLMRGVATALAHRLAGARIQLAAS